MNRKREFIRGYIDTVPLGISVAIYGLVYGVLGASAGLSILEIAAMSMFVFAGASQIAAVQMIALGSSPFSVILTIFIINLRHFLMSASISPYLSGASTKMKMLTSFFMTDESYAVTYSHYQKKDPSPAYFLGSGLNIYTFWGTAGVMGVLFGSALPESLKIILDFAFAAAFIGMLVPMIKDLPVVITVIAAGIISVLGAIYIPGKWYIIIAALVASFAGYIVQQAKEAREADVECKGPVVDQNTAAIDQNTAALDQNTAALDQHTSVFEQNAVALDQYAPADEPKTSCKRGMKNEE